MFKVLQLLIIGLFIVSPNIYAKDGNNPVCKKIGYYTSGGTGNISSNEILTKTFIALSDSVLLPDGCNWLKINIENNSAFENFNMVISLKAREYFVYQTFRNSLEPLEPLYYQSLQKKKLIKDKYYWYIHLPNNKSKIFYISLKNAPKQKLKLNSVIFEEESSVLFFTKELFFIGFELALFIFIFIYVLFAYIAKPEKMLLSLLVYLFSCIIFFLCIHNVFGHYLFKKYSSLNYSLQFIHDVGLIFYVYFLAYTLDIKNNLSKVYNYFYKYFLIAYSGNQMFFILISFYSYSFYNKYHVYVSFIAGIINIMVFIVAYKRYNKYQRFIASGFYISILIIILGLLHFGFLQYAFYLPYEIGTMFAILIFVYALNYRTKQLFIENEKLERKYLALKQKQDLTKTTIQRNKAKILDNQNVTGRKIDLIDNDKNSLLLDKYVKSLVSKEYTEKQWNEFDMLFKEVHKGFIIKLEQEYPKLSKSEIRLCCLLRMSMTTKEISAVTNKTIRSVESMRSRLRQKMHISKDIALSVFMLKL